MYEIKPIIKRSKTIFILGQFWWIVVVLALTAGGIIYWGFLEKGFLQRKEKIAALPPYKQAKLSP